MIHAFLKTRLGKGERGIALATVVGLGAVMILLTTTAITFSLSGVVKARTDQDWNGAMAAAYAGIEEYQSRLSNDNTYQQYGNPASPFSATSTVTMPTGAQTNPAFGLGAAGSWATVPVSAGKTTLGSFRYEVDNSKYGSTGVLRIRSTGRVGKETRSVVANLKQQGFIDFLYFTDYEIQDPAISGDDAVACTKYAWAGRPTSNCGDIQFASGDVVNGPVHSNDTIRSCSATFNGTVTTADNIGSPINDLCTPATKFAVPGYPKYSPQVSMPPTNTLMKKEVRSDLTATDVPRPGCLYTGPTTITFNSDGTMNVRSPWTKATQIAGSPATSGSAPAMCGSISQLQSAAGVQNLTVPAQNLIYVQNIPSVSTDPNYWAPGTFPSSLGCALKSGKVTCYGANGSTSGNGMGYPVNNEVAPASTSYGYSNGDVFVQGQLHAAVTIASENYIYVTGDIAYQNPNVDILGLVATNAVWVWNPMNSSNNPVYSAKNRRIDAAILSVAHTFQVQNYSVGGNRGTLTINGAIAQKFRGPVGLSGGVGYLKNYVYDQRFRYLAPPKFLSPVSTTYGVSVLVEVKTAFKYDGTALP